MLRDFLDNIFAEIDSESLTDEEFDSLPETLTEEYNKAVYESLKGVLHTRETVSGQGKKLKFYFLSKGADLSGAPPVHVPNSNIYIGSRL